MTSLFHLTAGLRSKRIFWLFVVGLTAVLVGCASPTSIQVTGSETIRVTEYALVEQSTDNPTHIEFQNRVPQAINARRTDWVRHASKDPLKEPNTVLAPLGFQLSTNPKTPFGAYALYQNGQLVQQDILRFWPVKTTADTNDFSLPFETVDGQMMVATRAGLSLWPAGEVPQSGTQPYESAAPLADRRLANAGTGTGIGMEAPVGALLPAHSAADQAYAETFGEQTLAGRSFFFFVKDGLTGMSFDGEQIGFSYDQVVHGAGGVSAIFNPGGNDRIVWFYALRDGLWYYVEVGPGR